MKLIHLTLALAAALAACATQYKPPAGADTATISVLAPANDMFGISQNTSVAASAQCDGQTTLATFTPLMAERILVRTVAAGSRLYLRLGINSSRSYPLYRYCTNLVSFVPTAGATYSIKQSLTGDSCAVELLQQTGPQRAAAFEIHSAKPCW